MIRDSVTTHRGCYADCSFCAITRHQGIPITSRSEASILAELSRMAGDRHFHGTVSDLGVPVTIDGADGASVLALLHRCTSTSTWIRATWSS